MTGMRLEYFSSAWMTIEATVSIISGLAAGSFALLAFGGDSLIELASGFLVLAHLRNELSSHEIDSRRLKIMTTALLFALVPVITLSAVYSYVAGLKPEGSPLGIAIAVGAVVLMPYFWLQKKKIGRETRSLPLSTDAVESVTCFLMSVALLGGLLVEYLFGIWWVDYVATAIILVFVARESLESYRELRAE